MKSANYADLARIYSAPTPLAPTSRQTRTYRWRGGLEAACTSEPGPNHSENEDACLHVPSANTPVFCAVADGVGGGAMGHVASHALLAHCAAAGPSTYRHPKRLVDWIKQGDEVVKGAIARRTDKPGAATLVATWFLSGYRFQLVHIGDCRAYRMAPTFRGGWRISRLTEDQTYQNLGQPPPPAGRPDDPARMVGVGATGEPPLSNHLLGYDELLLLCSDGLHKFLDDQRVLMLVSEGLRSRRSLKDISRILVTAAKQQGSHDDVTALLVRRHRWFGAGSGYWLALLACLVAAMLIVHV